MPPVQNLHLTTVATKINMPFQEKKIRLEQSAFVAQEIVMAFCHFMNFDLKIYWYTSLSDSVNQAQTNLNVIQILNLVMT